MGKFQVEQRLEEHLKEYGRLAETDHRSLNIFSLDTEFNTVNKALGSDTGGLGQKGEIEWERFTQNHLVLCNLYPEMRDYRSALPSIRSDVVLPEKYAYEIAQELLTEGASEFIEPEVPTLIQ